MKRWKLGFDGFVMNYMIAGPKLTAHHSSVIETDQLIAEAKMRSEIVTEKPSTYTKEISLSNIGYNGCPWTYHNSGNNCFLDVSTFYSTLQKIEIEASTTLYVEDSFDTTIRIWTYMSVGIYLDGKRIGEQVKPSYKPIYHFDIPITLQKGRNVITALCENLGVRDSHNIFGIQVLEHRDLVSVELTDRNHHMSIYEHLNFLNAIVPCDSGLMINQVVPEGSAYCYQPKSPDYVVMSKPLLWSPLTCNDNNILVVPEAITNVAITVTTTDYTLKREFEFANRIRSLVPSPDLSIEENRERIFQNIAHITSLNRGPFGFAISNLLARKYLNQETEQDRELLIETLDLIERRVDCSDFLLCGLIRYINCYELDEELTRRTEEVLLNYRYWMTMTGSDAMCFWSENHSLMFYLSAMHAGMRYPQSLFPRANMTGEELFAYGRSKVLQWFDDVLAFGFEEFLSTVYMSVTLAALLNAVDFSDEDIAKKATVTIDRLLEDLSRHTFHGTIVAPMGRVYRDVIYPFAQGAQSIANLINPSAPYTYGEGWLAFLATSNYEIPAHLTSLMESPQSCVHTNGNAQIVLEKTSSYCLTSVASPRTSDHTRWNNICVNQQPPEDTHEFTKSLNECFHGTTYFQPGVFGYQQHMWSASLSNDSILFVNHPGVSCDTAGSRPGYWYGNGIMPAVRQEKSVLGAIYKIPDSHPIKFTHVYCPVERFDRVIKQEHWIFLQKDSGMLGLWCSHSLVPHNDLIFNCELRANTTESAYLCICGSLDEYETLESFIDSAYKKHPYYEKETSTLFFGDGFKLIYDTKEDLTQMIE